MSGQYVRNETDLLRWHCYLGGLNSYLQRECSALYRTGRREVNFLYTLC